MRIRSKPWARPELALCPYFTDDPLPFKGGWSEKFKNPNQPIHIELGCGKGGFISQIAPANININYIAIDIKLEMLAMARRKISATYTEADLETENIFLVKTNIESVNPIFSEEDEIERIYINFCNPWPKYPDKKHRLTHPRQLMRYKTFLKAGGEIMFKTDDDGLFNDSLEYFDECGFKIIWETRDLHNSDYKYNIMTEHEEMFSKMGITTKMLIASKN